MQEIYVVTKEFIDEDEEGDHSPDLLMAFRERRLADEYVETAQRWNEENRSIFSYTIHVVPLADAPA